MPRAVCTWRLRSARDREVSSRGSSTLRKAESTGIRLYIWKMKPTWRARQAVSFARLRRLISSPATVMLPAVGTSSPPIRLSSVVLPEPLGPMKATNSPLSTLRFTPWRTCSSSLPRRYVFDTSLTTMRWSVPSDPR